MHLKNQCQTAREMRLLWSCCCPGAYPGTRCRMARWHGGSPAKTGTKPCTGGWRQKDHGGPISVLKEPILHDGGVVEGGNRSGKRSFQLEVVLGL